MKQYKRWCLLGCLCAAFSMSMAETPQPFTFSFMQDLQPKVSQEDVQALKTPLVIVFDPLTTEPYKEVATKQGTNIISPSWFELTETGVKVSPKASTSYVQAYHTLGYDVWPLITNQFSAALTSRILKNPTEWTTYSDQLVELAHTYGFQGYNFDFENINYKDKEALVRFVHFLSEELHRKDLYVSMDVTGYSTSPEWSLVYDRPALSKSVDYLVLMAYDETWAASPKSGPVASYPWVKRNLDAFLKEVPADKVVLGVPFYMRTWETPVNGTVEGKAKSKTLSMTDSLKYMHTYKSEVEWNPTLQSYYLSFFTPSIENASPAVNTVANNGAAGQKNQHSVTTEAGVTITKDAHSPGGIISIPDAMMPAEKGTGSDSLTMPQKGIKTEIWFEDPRSLAAKFTLARDSRIAGIAAWRKGFEDKDILPLMQKELAWGQDDESENDGTFTGEKESKKHKDTSKEESTKKAVKKEHKKEKVSKKEKRDDSFVEVNQQKRVTTEKKKQVTSRRTALERLRMLQKEGKRKAE